MLRVVCYQLWSNVIGNAFKQSPFKHCGRNFTFPPSLQVKIKLFRIKGIRHTWFGSQHKWLLNKLCQNKWFSILNSILISVWKNEWVWCSSCFGWLQSKNTLKTTDTKIYGSSSPPWWSHLPADTLNSNHDHFSYATRTDLWLSFEF